MTESPVLLRVPERFQSVADVLGAAAKMNLPNIVVISELGDGRIVFLETDMTVASANWLLDRLKALLLMPGAHERLP
jgi:hypothetical protein